MPEAVTVTLYKAKDGSTHVSAAMAAQHDQYKADRRRRDEIHDVIWQDFATIASSRIEGWSSMEDWQQRDIIDDFADLITNGFDRLSKIEGLGDGRKD